MSNIENSSNSSRKGSACNTSSRPQISPQKHWCFTLNNYTADDISMLCSNSSIEKYVFQEEIGKEGKTPHLQGYIHFKEKVRPMNIFDKTKNVHWEKTKNISASIGYCSKEDTRAGKIYTKGISIEEPLKLLTAEQLYKWQSDILSEISKEPDDRSINVVVDKIGNKGKTQLCKLLCAKYNALCVSGKSSDIKYAIVKYKEQKRIYPKIILIDVPRSHLDYISYEAIEKVKDGLFFCGKYESTQVIMNSPHVYIFMNEQPDTNKMSKDRWKITNL